MVLEWPCESTQSALEADNRSAHPPSRAAHPGIGSGFLPASPEQSGAPRNWHFRFGLCATEDGQLIPAEQAGELERSRLLGRGIEFTGGFRAFTPEENNPVAVIHGE